MDIHTMSPSPAENYHMIPPPVGTTTLSLPCHYGEISAPPPYPTGALRFVGADTEDRGMPQLLVDR
jgi:hypothetical protein